MWPSTPEAYFEDDQIKVLHDWTDKSGDRWIVYMQPSLTDDSIWVTGSYIDWQEGWYWDKKSQMLHIQKGVGLTDEGTEKFLDVVTDIQEVK